MRTDQLKPQTQSTLAETTPPRHVGVTSLFWILALLVLYILSIGPVIELNATFHLTRNHPALEWGVRIFYSPIMLSVHNSPPLTSGLDWYLTFWHNQIG